MTQKQAIAIPAQSPAVLALKAHWRDNPALSSAMTLSQKLAAIDAAKAGAAPAMACYSGQGWTPPAGLSWQEIEELRARFDTAPHLAPVALARGRALAWGVPIDTAAPNWRYMWHAGNVGGGHD